MGSPPNRRRLEKIALLTTLVISEWIQLILTCCAGLASLKCDFNCSLGGVKGVGACCGDYFHVQIDFRIFCVFSTESLSIFYLNFLRFFSLDMFNLVNIQHYSFSFRSAQFLFFSDSEASMTPD